MRGLCLWLCAGGNPSNRHCYAISLFCMVSLIARYHIMGRHDPQKIIQFTVAANSIWFIWGSLALCRNNNQNGNSLMASKRRKLILLLLTAFIVSFGLYAINTDCCMDTGFGWFPYFAIPDLQVNAVFWTVKCAVWAYIAALVVL